MSHHIEEQRPVGGAQHDPVVVRRDGLDLSMGQALFQQMGLEDGVHPHPPM